MTNYNASNRQYARVLNTKLDLVTYDSAWSRIQLLIDIGKPSCVAAANTHLIAEAASNDQFSKVLDQCDLVVPDGMPLVWALRLDGYHLPDRVYGPLLMHHILKHSPSSLRHYFFGGSESCLEQLKSAALDINHNLTIVGATSPPFREWRDEEESAMIDAINKARPDCIWVALGGVRQETWIVRNLSKFNRGVFLAVGDAFILVAGIRPYAPAWVQRTGFTWLFRLLQEPSRLGGRYMIYNTRFIVSYMKDRFKYVWGNR